MCGNLNAKNNNVKNCRASRSVQQHPLGQRSMGYVVLILVGICAHWHEHPSLDYEMLLKTYPLSLCHA